jgi:hypothetical protein
MLAEWQSRFPFIFKDHHEIFTNLNLTQQQNLSELLTFIESKRLLNETMLNELLKKSSYNLYDLI